MGRVHEVEYPEESAVEIELLREDLERVRTKYRRVRDRNKSLVSRNKELFHAQASAKRHVAKIQAWLRYLYVPLRNARTQVRPSADGPCGVDVYWHTGADTVVEMLEYLDKTTTAEEPTPQA